MPISPRRCLLWLGLSSTLVFLSLLSSACSEPACAKRWRIFCSCCSSDAQRQRCDLLVEDKHIRSLPASPTDEQIAACVSFVQNFRCQDQLETNLLSFCPES